VQVEWMLGLNVLLSQKLIGVGIRIVGGKEGIFRYREWLVRGFWALNRMNRAYTGLCLC
jgi:hypothetical protein